MKVPSRRILVIEDEADIRERIVKGLGFAGYTVSAANDGAEGIAALKTQRADVIICDMMMPSLNGFGTLTVLKDRPDLASIPVIVLTALGEKTTRDFAFGKGARGYLTKPFQLSELVEMIEGLFEPAAPDGEPV
ncbi:MAG: response regulator [Minwuia sp.]|nr:response regulator [Minwuia sp.]